MRDQWVPGVQTAALPISFGGLLSISADHTIMTLTPNSPLNANSSYTVSVSGVQDVSGNVAPAFSSSFATGTATVTTRPSVISVSPVNGATNVVTNAIVVTFNAAMDATTVNSGTLPVRINNSTLVNGSYSVNGAVVSFAPAQSLPANTSITMTVNTSQVVDAVGNGANFFQSSFTTGPIGVSLNPNNSALPLGQTQQFTAVVTN